MMTNTHARASFVKLSIYYKYCVCCMVLLDKQRRTVDNHYFHHHHRVRVFVFHWWYDDDSTSVFLWAVFILTPLNNERMNNRILLRYTKCLYILSLSTHTKNYRFYVKLYRSKMCLYFQVNSARIFPKLKRTI